MSNVIKVRFRRHTRASASARKSSAVTRLSVADLIATAKSFESQVLPLRSRDTVVRSQGAPVARIRKAIASSSKPSFSMNFDRCMDSIVHTMHGAVNGACASKALEPNEIGVHNTHMAKGAGKEKPKQPHTHVRGRTFLKEYRDAAKLTQQAAVDLGVHTDRTTLSKIETGEVPYSQNVLEAAARAYKTSIWHLLYCPPDTPLSEALKIWTKSTEPAGK